MEDHLNRKSKNHQSTNLLLVKIGKFKLELTTELSMLIETEDKQNNINTLSTTDTLLITNLIFMNREELLLFLLLNLMELNSMPQEVDLALKINLEF